MVRARRSTTACFDGRQRGVRADIFYAPAFNRGRRSTRTAARLVAKGGTHQAIGRSRGGHIMALAQLLGGQRRAKVRVVLPDQRDGVITRDIRQAVVRSTTPPIRNRMRTAIAVSLQQPV